MRRAVHSDRLARAVAEAGKCLQEDLSNAYTEFERAGDATKRFERALVELVEAGYELRPWWVGLRGRVRAWWYKGWDDHC